MFSNFQKANRILTLNFYIYLYSICDVICVCLCLRVLVLVNTTVWVPNVSTKILIPVIFDPVGTFLVPVAKTAYKAKLCLFENVKMKKDLCERLGVGYNIQFETEQKHKNHYVH